MDKKVLLVLVDGMRPDSLTQCGDDFLLQLADESTSCLSSTTIMPSVTLPCHASLFLSVDAQRHGITTNTWMPQVRPTVSLGDAIAQADGKTGMFFNWEQLRDLNRPGTMDRVYYERLRKFDNEPLLSDISVTDQCLSYMTQNEPDFVFLYLGVTDELGHKFGWMSKEYLAAVQNAVQCIRRAKETLSQTYHIIVTADHGGHDRSHGTDLPEDMTIPIILHGPCFEAGKKITGMNIKDIAPTIVDVLGVKKPDDWEGKSILS